MNKQESLTFLNKCCNELEIMSQEEFDRRDIETKNKLECTINDEDFTISWNYAKDNNKYKIKPEPCSGFDCNFCSEYAECKYYDGDGLNEKENN